MTNGEKLKEIFPYLESDETDLVRVLNMDNLKSWWNAEYKEPTKNVLAVDCIVDVLGSYTDLDIPYKREIAENILTKLPSVTPQEPKTGHWISHREHCENLGVMPSGLGAYEWCSNCDCGIDVREWHRNHYNFCPNCGTKMFEPQESEE